MDVKIRELIKRTASSILLIVFTLYLNYVGGYYFFSVVFVLFLFLNLEYYKLFSLEHKNIIFFVNLIFKFICIYLSFLNSLYLIIIPFLLGISLSSFHKRKWHIRVFPYIYFVLPACLIIYLNSHVENGKSLIIWLFVIVWTSDIFGFLLGSYFKGPKLIISISPNKTWSGFIGSITFGSLASILFAFYSNLANFMESLILGIVVSFSSIIGDLFESHLKRLNNKKDTSNLIPGHGGLLDRLDGFLFAIVIFWICIIK